MVWSAFCTRMLHAQGCGICTPSSRTGRERKREGAGTSRAIADALTRKLIHLFLFCSLDALRGPVSRPIPDASRAALTPPPAQGAGLQTSLLSILLRRGHSHSARRRSQVRRSHQGATLPPPQFAPADWRTRFAGLKHHDGIARRRLGLDPLVRLALARYTLRSPYYTPLLPWPAFPLPKPLPLYTCRAPWAPDSNVRPSGLHGVFATPTPRARSGPAVIWPALFRGRNAWVAMCPAAVFNGADIEALRRTYVG
ncbi:hypothetical protein BDY21DRAFT_134064 [Lineolata rhizophorae]|uniref:Uncharacterized protein n=1 Tax=Lineolata rhizophorae TaxID=578093 RepID=A0A6A6PAN7_9PEZI|nr:hypothetical protein BDY21DRAFT_134064 [Lineolata rhizophorae]